MPSETPLPAPSYDRAQERFIAVGTGVIWRGIAGECGRVAPLLERSTDDGENWVDVTPTYLEIGELIALNSFAGTEAEIVASMGEACRVQALRTFTQGQFWESYPDVLASLRYINPVDSASIERPIGAVAAPCADARDLHSAGAQLAISCDGVTYRLNDDSSWSALPASNVAALAIADSSIVVAHLSDVCNGLALTRYAEADGTSGDEVGCVSIADVSAPVTIATSGDGVLVWSGDEWKITSP
ncbi:hypothetical protein DC31_02200 [Microbacterium sp. CH12i]|uniref:hypothetical protein n=1 Tax=Microbacterium sp. CH12i TaxID=1479651 RepID=UPI00046143B4|nr:hypothetical protein [Microbacterium sp. CH12i]KDA05224.1 hypothetical protein DC31_02200 [Microbacterium sp. CH12i]